MLGLVGWGKRSCPQIWFDGCDGAGLDRLPPWTRTHIRPAAESGRRRAGRAGRGRGRAGRPGPGPLADPVRAERVLVLRRLVDRLEGQWLKELAAVDARGAAGAEQDRRLARPPPGCGPAAAGGRGRQQLGPDRPGPVPRPPGGHRPGPDRRGHLAAHAGVLAPAPRTYPTTWPPRPNRSWSRRPRRLDPPRLRRVLGHLQLVADPDSAEPRPSGATGGGGCGWPRPWRGWSPWTGCWSRGRPELAGRPGAAGPPADADDTRSGSQRNADALAELARRALEVGQLPQVGGVRPQLTVTVDLDSLLGRPGAWG